MNDVILRTLLAPVAAAVLCLAASSWPGATAVPGPIERIVATAADLTGGSAGAGRIDIVIERWSTDAEADNLLKPLLASGPDKLLAAIQTVTRRVGFIQSPGVGGAGARAHERRARNIFFARQIVSSSGRQVIVATDHHLNFGEAEPPLINPDGTHSWAYAQPPEEEFMLVDVRFGADGKGVGKFATAANVAYDKDTKAIEVTNFDAQPVRLMNVRSEKVITLGDRQARR
jgi:hypothetical protein